MVGYGMDVAGDERMEDGVLSRGTDRDLRRVDGVRGQAAGVGVGVVTLSEWKCLNANYSRMRKPNVRSRPCLG